MLKTSKYRQVKTKSGFKGAEMKLNFLPHYKHRMIRYDCNNYVREQDCRENIEKAYEQGRTDTIDDFMEVLKNEWTLDSILCATDKYRLIAIFKKIAEELKEQNNG